MSKIFCEDTLGVYSQFEPPTAIISDGPYGLGIYPGETRKTTDLADFYHPHVEAWTKAATPQTTLWFWNSEVGWAETHHIMREFGWEYRETTTWNKGVGHIAGKVNSKTIRGVPVVTEICVRYVRPTVFLVPDKTGGDGTTMHAKDWLRSEWFRSGLPMNRANEACGVKSAATRKWLTADHMWYMPDVEAIRALGAYCDEHGDPEGQPYFQLPGGLDATKASINALRAKWNHEHGITNVWDHPAVRGAERIKVDGKAVHPNQKPIAFMERQVALSTDPGDVVWEPFGGTFSACAAAKSMNRSFYGSEVNERFYQVGKDRLDAISD